jgi:hypothetical protein
MTSDTSNLFTRFIKKVRGYGSTPFDKDAIDLVFSLMLLFMLTCVGSMLMICFFFEMDKREMDKKSSSPSTESQRSSVLPASSPSAFSK